MHVELEASEPTWISITDADGKTLLSQLLLPGSPKTLDLDQAATLRTGNAGGLVVRFNDQPIGPLGPRGKIREIEFKDGAFRILPDKTALSAENR